MVIVYLRMVCFAGAISGSALYGVAVCTPFPGASNGRRAHAGSERARPPDARGCGNGQSTSMMFRASPEDTEPPEEWRWARGLQRDLMLRR